MFCPACAAANPAASARCRGCGGQIHRATARHGGATAPSAPRPAGADRPERSRTSPRLATSLLVVAPLLVLLGIGAGYRRAEQADLAAAYADAERAVAAGRYDEALAAYAVAGDHRDAAARRATVAADVAPHRAAYLLGVEALAAGRYDDAIAALLPLVGALPRYEDAPDLLAEARRQRTAELRRQADDATLRRDWLAAERALAELAATDPADAALAARLADLRRQHAPILFARDAALSVVGPDGADERLLAAGVPVTRPLWSPDRTRIAFVSVAQDQTNVPADLYVVGADGNGLRRLVGQVHPNAVPVWSPDGARLAYTSVAAFDLRQDRGLLGVHVVDLASGRDVDLTAPTGRHAMTPSWSPTGDQLAFVSRAIPDEPTVDSTNGPGEVYVLTLATGDAVDLTRNRIPDVVRVLWSPTADRLLVFGRTWDSSFGDTNATARLFRLDLPPGPGRATLTTIEADVLADTPGWSPAWAPDGEGFAYVVGDRTVVVRDRAGRETRIDVEPDLAGALTWAPGGEALLAVAATPREPSILLSFAPDAPGPPAPPTQTEAPIVYDTDWPTGTPQWAALNPAPVGPPAPPAASPEPVADH